MQTRRIGDLEVSAIGLGGMPLSIGGRPDEKAAIEVIHAAVEAGMTLIDTADSYCKSDDDFGHNERLVKKALDGLGATGRGITVATKGGLKRPGGDWVTCGRPDHLKQACEASLRNLGVDSIELYQLHAPDDDVPWADSVGAMAELRQAGKVKRVGISNVSVAEIDEARAIVDVASVQNRANPFDTSSFDNGVVGHCARHGIAFLPHSPVGGHRGHARTGEHEVLARVARRRDASPYEVILAWFLSLHDVIVPIPGASRPASARSSASAADLTLEADDLAELGAAFPGFGLASR